jgi:hypothetical protein
MSRIVTDERCSVSLSELMRDHTISDVLFYLESLNFSDECRRSVE